MGGVQGPGIEDLAGGRALDVLFENGTEYFAEPYLGVSTSSGPEYRPQYTLMQNMETIPNFGKVTASLWPNIDSEPQTHGRV